MVDIIIPVYKPDASFTELLDKLKSQTLKPEKIILMNTEKEYFDRMIEQTGYVLDEDLIEVHHIKKADFDHGGTRNQGVGFSKSDIFVMMTQDAIPVDEYFVEKLTAKLSDDKVACSYARQVAKENSTLVEKVTRKFNYPEESMVKTANDMDRLGIKTFFCSNVSCAYSKKIFEELGGFVNHTIFNEDMIYASKVIKAGYSIAYASDAAVYHSHNYSAKEQFHRNVDIGVSQADHPEVFEGISSESEGKKMVKLTIKELIDAKQKRKILPYVYMTGCKYLGFRIGKRYKKYPLGFIKKCSMNPGYFE